MKVLLKIGIGILNIIYFFIKLFRTRNKITLISRQSNKPSVDFKMLESKLSKKYEVVVLCKMIDNGLKNKIKYFFHIFRQMYHIATSKVVILDT